MVSILVPRLEPEKSKRRKKQMPKMKSHRGAAKDSKTGSGKIKRAKAYASHSWGQEPEKEDAQASPSQQSGK